MAKVVCCRLATLFRRFIVSTAELDVTFLKAKSSKLSLYQTPCAN
jgi:hypothetical protein